MFQRRQSSGFRTGFQGCACGMVDPYNRAIVLCSYVECVLQVSPCALAAPYGLESGPPTYLSPLSPYDLKGKVCGPVYRL